MDSIDDFHKSILSWANELEKAGVTRQAFTEQFSCLVYLKMVYEASSRALNPVSVIEDPKIWAQLCRLEGEELENFYFAVLQRLGRDSSQAGTIFRRANNAISSPAQLRKFILEVVEPNQWLSMKFRIRGDLFEALIEDTVRDTRSKAGEHFTPRPLVRAIVSCLAPNPSDTVLDPACGTGGFLLEAYRRASKDAENLPLDQRQHLNSEFLAGVELVEIRARLAQMNLLMNAVTTLGADPVIQQSDSLLQLPARRWTVVMSNPPYADRSRSDGDLEREDFWIQTASNAANFIQHIRSVLEVNGRCAVGVPDGLLFDSSFTELRRRLLTETDCHTLLRVHPGIWHKSGTKANFLFFDKKPASERPWTEKLWVYDLRTRCHFTPVQKPLTDHHMKDFVESFCVSNRTNRVESDRFRSFMYEELMQREAVNLDLAWMTDDEETLPMRSPQEIIDEMTDELQEALASLTEIRKIFPH